MRHVLSLSRQSRSYAHVSGRALLRTYRCGCRSDAPMRRLSAPNKRTRARARVRSRTNTMSDIRVVALNSNAL